MHTVRRMRRTITPPPAWRPFIDSWMDYLKTQGTTVATRKTRRYKLIRLATLLKKNPMDVAFDDLTHVLASQEWKRETLRAYKNTIRSFYKWMKISGHRPDNPAQSLPATRKKTPHPNPAPEAAIRRAYQMANQQEKTMIRLAAECGLRRMEISQVNSQDVIPAVSDPTGYDLIVNGKGGKDRIVPLPGDLAAIILKMQGWLYPGRFHGHVEASYIGKHVSRLLPKGYSTHSLRHRYATMNYESTNDIYLVSSLLGHESAETTRAYVRMSDAHLRSSMAAVRLPTITDADENHA